MDPLLDRLRAAGKGDRNYRQSQFDAAVRFCAKVFGHEYADLGSLRGNVGNSNYELPASLGLRKYRAVVIWCKRFSVAFAAAPLRTIDSVR